MTKKKLKKKEEYYRERFKEAVKNYQTLIIHVDHILDKPEGDYPMTYPKGCAPKNTVLFKDKQSEIKSLLEEAVGWESGFDVYEMSLTEIVRTFKTPLKLCDLAEQAKKDGTDFGHVFFVFGRKRKKEG